MGVPYEEIDSAVSAGMVHVVYGKSFGLAGTGSLTLYQGHPDISNTSEVGDRFGMALASGSFDGDSYADLAVGAPGEDLSLFAVTYIDAGAVHAFYGSATGLSLDGDQFWHQSSTDIEGVCEDDDEFGRSLAAYYRVKVYRVYLPLIRND